jgi:RNA polymerase sigma-70 factor (ECF subfamily)
MSFGGQNTEREDALVEALARGDEEALRALYHRYAALAFTVAARVLDAGAAEGIVQDVFHAIWTRREAFDPARGSFKGWVTRIARNRALNEARRQRGVIRGHDDALASLADDALEPDEALWAEHRRAAIRAAVDVLPAAQRKALSLAFFDELSHEQVAAALRIPVGTAKTRIRLALKRLAPVLAAALFAAALVIAWRRSEERQARDERALRVVTSSDVVPLRLELAPGATAAADAHGLYRARPGGGLAVLTTSHLPPVTGDERYVAWIRQGSRWRALGVVEVGSDGRSLTVFENPAVTSPPDEVRITRELHLSDAPQGAPVVVWSADARAPRSP